MPIKTFEAVNFLVFKCRDMKEQIETTNARGPIRDSFHLDFCDGINILIGGNGVGKTSILRMLYAACEWSSRSSDHNKTQNILNYFGISRLNDTKLRNFDSADEYALCRVKTDRACFEWRLSQHDIFNMDQWLDQEIQSVFIPTMEMLSHAKGFLALNEKFNMPFDGTQVDIIVNAELPPTREISDLSLRLLKRISAVIDGEVVFENDTFYVRKSNGNMVEFSLEAEGFRKFALIWKLLRNGLLSPGSILFWDEPEANINPELIPVLVDVLLELQRNGVQIFLATHSYNLARYFDVSRTASDQVQYVSLRKENAEIVPYTAKKYMDIPYNPIECAGDKLFKAIVVKADEDATNGE